VFFPIPFAEFHPLVVSVDKMINTASEQRDQLTEQQQQQILAVRGNITATFATPFDSTNPEALNARINYLKSIVPSRITSRPLVVHKDRGFFDTNDFGVVSLYGVDYINARGKLAQKAADGDATRLLDLSAIFLGQSDVHIMRTIEPSLRIRYHPRQCSSDLSSADLARCQISHKSSFGTKSQLANLLFGNVEDLQFYNDAEAQN
jgi:chondroitin polymerizing factor